MPIAYFYDEMDKNVAKQSPAKLQGKAPARIDLERDPMARRETLVLVRAYYRIEDRDARQRLTNMIRAIAAGE